MRETKTNLWSIKGYKGRDDFEFGDNYNIDYLLEIDQKISKQEVEQMLFFKYKNYRIVSLKIKMLVKDYE